MKYSSPDFSPPALSNRVVFAAHPSMVPQMREAPVRPPVAGTRTVTVCFTSGASVRRSYLGKPYDEILVVSPDAVDLTRLNSGAPVLDSHNAAATAGQVAVVDRAWISGGRGYCEIRFPEKGIDPAADRMFAMVAERIIRNVSVGYRPTKVKVIEAEKRSGKPDQWIVEGWTPYEVSFVTVPADAGAQVQGRSQPATKAEMALARMRMRALEAGLR